MVSMMEEQYFCETSRIFETCTTLYETGRAWLFIVVKIQKQPNLLLQLAQPEASAATPVLGAP